MTRSFLYVIASLYNRILVIELADGYIYAKISSLWVLAESGNHI